MSKTLEFLKKKGLIKEGQTEYVIRRTNGVELCELNELLTEYMHFATPQPTGTGKEAHAIEFGNYLSRHYINGNSIGEWKHDKTGNDSPTDAIYYGCFNPEQPAPIEPETVIQAAKRESSDYSMDQHEANDFYVGFLRGHDYALASGKEGVAFFEWCIGQGHITYTGKEYFNTSDLYQQFKQQ